jgi:hypothetical protein
MSFIFSENLYIENFDAYPSNPTTLDIFFQPTIRLAIIRSDVISEAREGTPHVGQSFSSALTQALQKK